MLVVSSVDIEGHIPDFAQVGPGYTLFAPGQGLKVDSQMFNNKASGTSISVSRRKMSEFLRLDVQYSTHLDLLKPDTIFLLC